MGQRAQPDLLPLRRDFAGRIKAWIDGKSGHSRTEPLFQVTDKRTAEMVKKDLEAARVQWINEAGYDQLEQRRREKSSFLAYIDENGHYADFHALRKTFITNLSRAGVSPKTAQLLARHSDTNLTMNTYTMLGVMDQAAAVEALPALPAPAGHNNEVRMRATGTDGQSVHENGGKKVPPVVPRGAETGAKRLASRAIRIAPSCLTTVRRSARATNTRTPKPVTKT